MPADLYDELGVDRDADEQTIRRAFRRRAKETHPDAGGTAEAFAATSTALAILTDPKRRKRYDRTVVVQFEIPPGGAVRRPMAYCNDDSKAP